MIYMRPSATQAAVLFSPPVVLILLAVAFAVEGELPEWAAVLSMLVLAICVAASELVRLHIHDDLYRKRGWKR